MSSRTFETFLKIEQQLSEERANALTRIGAHLERLLRSLDELTRQCRERSGSARARALEAYHRDHEEACRYRWYLEVQRESLGLWRHDVLDRVYPLPPRTPSCMRSTETRSESPV